MGIFRTTLLVATLAIAAIPASAGRLNLGTLGKSGAMHHLPPAGYSNQWWVHPSGCEYSRAGRPGEIVWYVIINSIGRKKCPRLIVQQAMDNAYDGLTSTN